MFITHRKEQVDGKRRDKPGLSVEICLHLPDTSQWLVSYGIHRGVRFGTSIVYGQGFLAGQLE